MNVYIVSSLAVLSVAVGGALAFPGGWNVIAIDDAKVVELADWAVGEIGNGYSLLEITGAEYQVRVSYLRPSKHPKVGHHRPASETAEHFISFSQPSLIEHSCKILYFSNADNYHIKMRNTVLSTTIGKLVLFELRFAGGPMVALNCMLAWVYKIFQPHNVS